MSSAQLYDTIGATYTVTRRTEPRIAARVWAALGDARTVLNVGAGTGSYEPPGRDVTTVEPSALMRAQRLAGAAPCVAAAAESLPFEDQSFDAAMAFSTVHHWQDPIAGLREMRRVARRVVVFTFDASDTGWRRRFWLTRDYLPEAADLLVGRPSLIERPARSGPGWSRCSFRGTAPTASSRPTGAGPRHTWTIMYVAEYRCGPESGRRPSSGRCAASVMTLSQAGGPNATATSSLSMQRSLAFGCS
jgi:SAM-dependent methyltransferase